MAEHEIALVDACAERLEAHRAALALAGLVAHLRGVTDLPNGGAEVTIDFEGPGGIADVLEFMITKNGQPALDADGLRTWLNEVLPSVIKG